MRWVLEYMYHQIFVCKVRFPLLALVWENPEDTTDLILWKDLAVSLEELSALKGIILVNTIT